MTKTLPVSELAQNFDAVLNDIAKNGDEVLIEKGGQVVAQLLPTETPEAMPASKTVSAAEFAQHCATFIDTMTNAGELFVERDGQTVARLIATGPMYGTMRILGDIISPVTDPEDWTADEENVVDPLDRP